MKELLFTTCICLLSFSGLTQSASDVPVQNVSTDSAVIYRLFSTKNIYTFIKLNTRNGKLTQIQWGTESKYQYETILSDIARVTVEQERNGRFFLYPTRNMYNFILIDQIDGRVWQVQWSTNVTERMVDRIY